MPGSSSSYTSLGSCLTTWVYAGALSRGARSTGSYCGTTGGGGRVATLAALLPTSLISPTECLRTEDACAEDAALGAA